MSLQKEIIHESTSENESFDNQADYLCVDEDGNINVQSVGSSIQVSFFLFFNDIFLEATNSYLLVFFFFFYLITEFVKFLWKLVGCMDALFDFLFQFADGLSSFYLLFRK